MAGARDSMALGSPTCFTVVLIWVTLTWPIIGTNSSRFGLSSDVVLPRFLLPRNSQKALSQQHPNAVLVPSATFKNTSLQGTDLCNLLHMNKQQQKYCRQGEGMAETLVDAVDLATTHCRQVFQYERWDCNLLEPSRLQILKSAFKETAVLYAFSSAALEHSISRACAADKLKKCHCAEASNKVETRQTWKWGGCGDNLRFGRAYTNKFFSLTPGTEHEQPHRPAASKPHVTGSSKSPYLSTKRPRRQATASTNSQRSQTGRRSHRKNELALSKRATFDLRSRIDRHNIRLGMQVVESLVRRTCKCHGVSSSCTMQTCWSQLAAFPETAAQLKRKYETAVQAKVSYADNIAGNSQLTSRKTFAISSSTSSPVPASAKIHGYTLTSAVWAKSSSNAAALLSGAKKSSKQSAPPQRQESSNEKRAKADNVVFKANKNALVFLDKSPDFCLQSSYGNGTSGRECLKGENCDVMCCGRGYNIQQSTVTVSCKCKLINQKHCCEVNCQSCTSEKLIYSCK